MPNTQYRGGSKVDYALTSQGKKNPGVLWGLGCVVAQRSAGSHSPVDVWAIDPKIGLMLIQCKKSGAITRKKRMELWALADLAHGQAFIASWHKPTPSAARRVLLERIAADGALYVFAFGQDEERAS